MLKSQEKRLFVGIQLNPSILDSVVQLIEKLKIKYDHPGNRMTWVRPENLHLTLKFLGLTPIQQIAAICEELKQVAHSMSGFDLSLEGVETFNSNSSRIRTPFPLWMGFSKTSDLQQLQGLVQQVEQRLSCFGFPCEEREFVPHLTIARVKALSRNHLFLPGKDPSIQKIGIGTWPVREIALFESELLPSGSVYRKLGEWPLEGFSVEQNPVH